MSVDELNSKGGLERGLTLVDLIWLAKALRFDVEGSSEIWLGASRF